MKNNKKIIVYAILVIILVVGGYFGFGYTRDKIRKVELGFAQSTFPWKDYSEKELNKLFPQIRYADVPTRVTPEETYAKFRQALKENNLKIAIEQLAEESERYDENVKILNKFYLDNKFSNLYDYYPKNIKKINMYESLAEYEFEYYSAEYEQNLIGALNFIKNSNGDWKLNTL